MDTAIIITGFIALAAGLVLGAIFWGHYADTVKAQAEEIDALNLNNLRLRGQCAELATMALNENEYVKLTQDLWQRAVDDCIAESMAHAATKRKLSAAKGQITKLRKAMGVEV